MPELLPKAVAIRQFDGKIRDYAHRHPERFPVGLPESSHFDVLLSECAHLIAQSHKDAIKQIIIHAWTVYG